MQLHFNKIRDFVYKVKLDLPFSYADLTKDFDSESWVANQPEYGQSDLVERYRLEWDQIKSPRIQQLQDYASSDQFRRCIIDRLYQEDLFPGYWSIGPDEMFAATTTFGSILRDRPGYHCGLHLDNRLSVATGMFYFAEHDDADISTEFYTSQQLNEPCRIPTGFGHGWIAANMHNSWHDGWNRSTQDRYSMIIGLVLKI